VHLCKQKVTQNAEIWK